MNTFKLQLTEAMKPMMVKVKHGLRVANRYTCSTLLPPRRPRNFKFRARDYGTYRSHELLKALTDNTDTVYANSMILQVTCLPSDLRYCRTDGTGVVEVSSTINTPCQYHCSTAPYLYYEQSSLNTMQIFFGKYYRYRTFTCTIMAI